MRHALLLLLVLGPVCARAAPRAAPPASRPHKAQAGRSETGVGFVLGPIGGIGFAWRRFREDGVGWQVGGLAYADREDLGAILGIQRMHTLRVHARSRLYVLAGAMHIRDRVHEDVLAVAPGPGVPPAFERRSHNDSSTRVGGGLGMSFGSSDGLCTVIELPLVARFDHRLELDGIAPIPQVALLYNF